MNASATAGTNYRVERANAAYDDTLNHTLEATPENPKNFGRALDKR